MSLNTEHRGYAIHYGENSDDWNCHALELSAPTLSALKRKIDAVERKTRQVESIPAFRIGYRSEIEPVVITAKVGKSSDNRRRYWDEKDGVWCVNPKDKTRRRVELKSLIEDTPDNRTQLDEYARLCAAVVAAEARAKACLEAIPRMAMDAMPASDPETDQ